MGPRGFGTQVLRKAHALAPCRPKAFRSRQSCSAIRSLSWRHSEIQTATLWSLYCPLDIGTGTNKHTAEFGSVQVTFSLGFEGNLVDDRIDADGGRVFAR